MNRLITSLIVVLATANLSAQQMTELPKLVVGITVDQLRSDYLQYLYNAFGEKGFKRLMQNGIIYENVNFDFNNPDRASAMAAIFSGTYPFQHGIISNSFFNPATLRVESILNDPRFMGNSTTETLSPASILTSTFCDELKIASAGTSRIYSFAPNSDQAIIGAGHSANGAFWIDNKNGKWATSTYYKDFPYYLDRLNRTEGLDKRIDDLEWEPMLPVSSYKFIPYFASEWSFKHSFGKLKKDKYEYFKSSALVNDEINKAVELFLKEEKQNTKQSPDFLSVSYNAAPYKGGNEQEYALEVQDTYIRLDDNIAKLLDAIDKTVGLNNAVVFLASTGCTSNEALPSTIYDIPTGEFHPSRCCALLNTYLMALYGADNWVSGYDNQQIYLDRKLIENKKIDINEIQTKAAEFVIQFAGVQDVVTSHQLLHGNWNEHIKQYRNGYHRKLSGDLILSLQPGWQIVFDDISYDNISVRNDVIPSPFIIFRPNLKAERISRPIDATEIAPTISRILRIRSPNACSSLPLAEIK
ncbi:MAG: alkaline phosphatase family protein [Bacteroidales bacterium]|nr:alkaline phosphatase family protein [Bacteroidales bacterium]